MAALKSGITAIRSRPDALPRFSTATRTRAACRPLSCRLPRKPACVPPIQASSISISPRRGSRSRSPSLGAACEASSRQFRSGAIPADAGARADIPRLSVVIKYAPKTTTPTILSYCGEWSPMSETPDVAPRALPQSRRHTHALPQRGHLNPSGKRQVTRYC